MVNRFFPLLLLSAGLASAPAIQAGTQTGTGKDSDSLVAEGRRLFMEGSLQEAGQVFRRAVPLLRGGDDRAALASCLNALSYIDSSQGDYIQAVESAREAASIRESLQDNPGRGDSLTNLGLALYHLGNYQEALTAYRAALALYEADSDWEGVSIERNNIGNVLLYQGRYLEALTEYQSALELVQGHAEQEWSPHEQYRSIVNLAALHQKLGSYQRALDLYSGLETGVLSKSEEALVLSNKGALYRHLGDAVKALGAYHQALDLFRRERDLDGEIGTVKNVGIALALDLGDLQGALRQFQEALDLAVATGNRREELQARLYRGETLRRLGRLDQAREDLQAALKAAEALGAVEEEWKGLYILGRLREQVGDAAGAEANFQSAIDTIESVRSRLQLGSLTPGFLADKRQVYDALIELLSRPYRVGDSPDRGTFTRIFQLVEKARSQAFLDQFSSSLEALDARAVPDAALRLRQIRAQAAVIWKRLATTEPADQPALQSELARLENDYLGLERQVQEKAPPGRGVPRLEEVETALGTDSSLVEFWVGEREWVALTVDAEGLRVSRTNFPDETGFSHRGCLAAVSNPSSQDWRQLCAPLAAALLDNLPKASQVRRTHRLILALDRFLRDLPLEAFSRPGEPMLLEDFEIERLPTAALLGGAFPEPGLASRSPWATSLLAFADPITKAPEPGRGFAETWPPLPYSAAEVERIAATLPGRAEIHLGAQARKEIFLEEMARNDYPVVHLATHATADPVSAERSRILFSPSGPEEPYDFLFLGEILGLPLRHPQLVVLSACETGRQKTQGAGVEDFGRAFLLAGARSVVATTWKVSDQASADFMEGFYAHLAQGEGAVSALRQAKLRFLHSGTTVQHPYYWAAFALYGRGFEPVRLPYSWRLVAVVAILILGVLFSTRLLSSKRPARSAGL